MQSLYSITVLTSCFVTVFAFYGIGRQLGMHQMKFYRMETMAFVGNSTLTKMVKDYFDCSFFCLESGPSACLSFNLARNSKRGYRTCVLINSEGYMDPERLKEHISYDYYGTSPTAFLFGLVSCISSPCNYGGTCTPGKRFGNFSCQCLSEVTVLPFIDDKCNVDKRKMSQGKAVKGVFHLQVGSYKLNYDDAKSLCALNGAQLASHSQLHEAWKAGAEQCALGWLIDNTVAYPMQKKKDGCGNRVGVIVSGPRETGTFNAWCYK